MQLNPRHIIFAFIFVILSLLAYNLNFSQVLGTQNQAFTLFQFIGPIAGSFLGPYLGSAAVLSTEIANFFLSGKLPTVFNLLRLTPMIFAAYYFGTSKGESTSKYAILLVPLACMFLFWLNPVGQIAWVYALYWLIPIGSRAFLPNNLFARSMGATFTAHAVGSVAFIYSFPSEPSLWLSLIPVVAYERLAFALGIAFSYLAMNSLLAVLSTKFDLTVLHIEPKYSLLKVREE